MAGTKLRISKVWFESVRIWSDSAAKPVIEELRGSLCSTRMHYTTYWRSPWRQDSGGHHWGFNKRFGDVLTSLISVRATAVNLADVPSCVACVLFWVHLFEIFDCVYFQRSCNVTNLECINLLQEQVAATLLDPRNMPDLNCIPPDQHDQGWALLRDMIIAVIDEVKNSDASTWRQRLIRRCQWFLGHGLRRCCCEFSRPFKRRDRWQGDQDMEDPFPRTRILSTSGVAVLCIFSLGWVCWRGVYLLFLQLRQLPSACFPRWVTWWWLRNVHVSRVSTRCGRRCGSGRRSRRCAWSNFFWIQTHFLQCLLLSLVCWLWDSIWMIVILTLARCFSSLFFSLYTYTYTYTYCYYYCILYFLVLTKPAPAWVPVKASFSTSDTIVTLYRHRSTNLFVSLDRNDSPISV